MMAVLQTVLQTLGLGAAMLVALVYFGYGVTQWLTPRVLAPYKILLMPFAGMALVIVWDYAALALNWNLTEATWALVAASAAVNVAAWLRSRKQQDVPLAEQFRDTRWVWLLMLLVFCAAVAPLWRYGYVTVIGENWDYEFYLPLADYLREFSTAQLVNAPPNPLLTTILSRHILPLPMGFSYLHATLDELLQQQALDTFAILLGVLRGLGVGAAFLFCRAGLKMSQRASLIATAFVAFNGLLLWFTYWNFGLHLAALALLPVALLFGILALEKGASWRALVGAGLVLGALNVTYHPALVAAGLPLGLLGLYYLIAHKERVQVVTRGLAVIGLTIAFSLPTLWHIEDFRREYYGRTPLAIGLREFVPPSDGYGFSLNILDLAVGHTIPTPWLYDLIARGWSIAAPLLTVVAVGLSLYALWKMRGDAEQRAVWWCVAGASVLYVLIFRLPFLRPYPYGFLKSLSLVIYILAALAVVGGERLWNWRPHYTRYVLGIVSIAGAALVLVTFALSVEQYFKPAPPFFNTDALKVQEVKTYLQKHPVNFQPPTLYVTDRAEAQKIPMGLVAYALRENELYGNVTTGYGALDNAQAGQVYDYALLTRGENPAASGYTAPPLWENDTFALYGRTPNVAYQYALNASTISPEPFHITVGSTQILSGTVVPDTTAGTREASLTFATFVPQQLTLADAKTTQEIKLLPGLSTVTLPALTTPTTLTLTPLVAQPLLDSAKVTIPHGMPDAEVRLWLAYAQLHQASQPNASRVTTVDNTILVTCGGSWASELDKRCFVVNPQATELTWRWIVRGTLAGTREERVIAQQMVNAAPQAKIDIRARLASGLMTLQFDDNPAQTFPPQPISDGKYRGDLEVYSGNVLLARIELYKFEVKDKGQTMTRMTPPDGALMILQP